MSSSPMSLSTQCANMFGFLFWATMNIAFLTTSIAFILFPKEAGNTLASLKSITDTDCWQTMDNFRSVSCTDHAMVVDDARRMVRAIGFVFLFATAGTNQLMSDAITSAYGKRAMFSMTTFYYISAIIGLLIITNDGLFILSSQKTFVMVMLAFFLCSLFFGLIGTTVVWCADCFTGILPSAIQKQLPTPIVTTNKLPVSRAAMSSGV